MIYRAAREFERVGLVQKSPGALTFTVLEAWFSRRGDRLILLTFLPREQSPRRVVNLALRVRFVLVERPAVRRAMRAGHVLTANEQRRYAALYKVPIKRFRHIPWAFSRRGDPPPESGEERVGVVSSGRASCDWETLFAAANRATWPLTVICGDRDRFRVDRLNRDGRAEVWTELSREKHDRLVRRAAVYALCVRDGGPSAGHVRLMAATDQGAAVVASDVPGLEGYVEPGASALTVAPGDPDGLRAAIDALLAAPERRRELTTRAIERARPWTYREMFDALGRLLTEV